MASSWKTLIIRLGEKCQEYGGTLDFKDHIETCYSAIWRDLDSSETEHQLLTFLLQCAEQLPHKSPLYATLVGLLNLEKDDLGKFIVDSTHSNLQSAISSHDCDKIRVLLRFLTVLMCSKVVAPSSVVVVFETLLSNACTIVDEEKGNPAWQARADFYINCILGCLPWGGAELVEQVPEEIDRVLVGIQAYFSIRKPVFDVGFSIFVDNDRFGANRKDFLEDLWSRIQDLSNNGWKLESIPRPHLSFEAQLVAGKSHEFGPINCPEQPKLEPMTSSVTYGKQKHEADLKYPQRIRKLNIFPQNKLEDLSPIDQFIMEEYLLDILLFLNGCRKECAAYMVSLPVPFRYEYLMAETIFSQLLLLPQPRFKPAYYALVIMDLCKALPGAFPAVVAGAVRALFDKIAELDMECRTRLILWFSHHLSNFQFIWPWEEWAYVLELPKWAPQRVFVQEVLEREVRLSYWEKIKQSIENAPGLEELLPPKGGPNLRVHGENGRNKALSEDLVAMVRGRQNAREVIAWVEESVLPEHGLDDTLQVVIPTLLNIGSKSFTHLITVLERYGQVIAKLCPDEDRQTMLINEVSTFWKNSTQMTAIAIDRMMGYRLISNLAIVRWVFSPANVDQFHTSDRPWEILRNAVSKTYNRICDLRKEIFSVKKRLQSAEEATASAKAELEAAESKLSLMNGEPVVGDNPIKLKRLKSSSDKAEEEETSLRESLEAKEALLLRALSENEALFLSLYKNFAIVLLDRLPEDSSIGTSRSLLSGQTDAMTLDSDEQSGMDIDQEMGLTGVSNGEKRSGAYNLSETDQWGLSTLGYIKAFTRQYASEIWPHFEKIDEEILSGNVHPLLRKAVYCGLGRLDDEQ